MQAVENAKVYDWQSWRLGIMRSFLSGGATALCTGAGGGLVGIPSKQVWILMGINFVLMGLYRLGEFLQIHGSPDPVALQVALNKATIAVEQAKAASPEASKA